MAYLRVLILFIVTLIVTACGGSSSYTDNSPKADNIGVYEDSPISGIEYKCGKYSGVTNSAGEFKYEFNKECKFSFFGDTIDNFASDTTAYKSVHLQIKNQGASIFFATLDSDNNLDNGFNVDYSVAKKYFSNFKSMSKAEVQKASEAYAKDMGFKLKSYNEAEEQLKKHQEKRLREFLSGKRLWLGVKICTNCTYDKTKTESENNSSKKSYKSIIYKYTFNNDATLLTREVEGETFKDSVTIVGNIFSFYTISMKIVAISNEAIKVERLDRDNEANSYEWLFLSKKDLDKKLSN